MQVIEKVKASVNSKQAPLDSGIVHLMPSVERVDSWYAAGCKRTDVKAYHDIRFAALQAYKNLPTYKQDKELLAFMRAQIPWDTFHYDLNAHNSMFKDLAEGAFLCDLAHFLQNATGSVNGLVHTALYEILNSACPIQLLTAAVHATAQLLYVPRNVHLKKLVDLKQSVDCGLLGAHLTILIIESGAQVTIRYDQHVNQGMHLNALKAVIHDNARVTVIADQFYESQAYALLHQSWILGSGSSLALVDTLTGGNSSWSFHDFELADRTASVDYCSLGALKGTENAALITRQQHLHEATKSAVLVKTMVSAAARSFYRGTITMSGQAGQSDADQQQRSLILSPQARTCAIPSLEVATDDVRCRHGSAAGRFNRQEIWFLASRGLAESQACELLIDGFYNGSREAGEQHAIVVKPLIDRLKNYYQE